MIDIYLLTKYYSIIIIYWMMSYTGMKNTSPYDSGVSKRKGGGRYSSEDP